MARPRHRPGPHLTPPPNSRTVTDTPPSSPNPAVDRARFVANQLPAEGLFAGHSWRIAPEPFPLDPDTVTELNTLGRVLLQFYRAVSLLYRQSVDGKRPPWIAHWLDLGKSPKVLGIQRSSALRNQLPRVIRPDILLTEDGFKITELDSVPGGIGLTAWLNHTYSELGMEVIGGPDGMLRGFASIFGQASVVHIVVAEESATYRPEMEWLARRLNMLGHCFSVRNTDAFRPDDGQAVYRFFEMFDLDQVPVADILFEAAARKRILLTPPPRSFLEEKLLFALLWNRHLRDFWRQELGSAFFQRLLHIVPRSWVLDPSPVPPHTTIPNLELARWEELKDLSQKERELILKISGYSPEAWGARGVHLGSDLSGADWASAVDHALASFHRNPYVLQRYEKPRKVEMRWVDLDRDTLVTEPGRVRLCPYYFVEGDQDHQRANLGGVLATLCTADKKIVHGMRDAVLAPCRAS